METPKVPKPKVKDLDKSEFDKRVMEAVAAAQPAKPTAPGGGTYSPAGGPGPSGVSALTPEQQAEKERRAAGFPEVVTGQLKPEFQPFEDVATTEEAISQLPIEEQIVTSELIKPSDTKRFFPDLSAKVEGIRKFDSPTDFLKEFKAAIKGIGAAVGLRKIGTFLGGDRLDKLKTSSDLVIQGVNSGSIDPATAQSMFDNIDIEIGKENSRVQLEAKYDIPSLIDGTSSEAQVEMLNLIRYNANKKAELAQALRDKMLQDIQSQTGTYKPGLGGK